MNTTPETTPNASDRDGRVKKFVFLGLFLPMAGLVLAIGFSVASLQMEKRIEEILDFDAMQLQLIGGFLGAEVLGSLTHLRSLSSEADTREALDSRDSPKLQLLASSFLSLARRNPLYHQVRWIDESGMERTRITRDKGKLLVETPQDLQNKSDRYYFKAANALLDGELYISRIDLNEERGQIEMPPRPVLRIATPVTDGNRKRRGIIVINIEMKYLFEFVRTTEQADQEANYLLVNQEGVLLHGEADSFRAEEGTEPVVDFISTHPEVWAQVSASEAGNLEAMDGMWTWRKLSPVDTFKRLNLVFPQHLVAFDQLISDDFSLTLMVHRPARTLADVRRENLLLISLATLSVLLVYGLTLFFYLSGNARTRRAELDAAYAKATASSMARMKELEERFHRLVEASSIGQLVVDGNGRIEISNPAAERILGYARGELEGLLVDALLPAGRREKHVSQRQQYMRAPEARQMGVGRELEAVRKDGSTFPVEVGLNPYVDNGRPLVLASIIDLSQREGE